ncbi:MAG: glutamate--cysteine ligase, partial [Alphaproteobacteria bacterium]
MSNPGESDPTPITSTRQMAEWFAAGCKPKSAWRIGTEHEKFGFRLTDYAPPPYEPQGIRAMLEGLMAKGWEPILDRGNPIGLKRGAASVSLEPGGQFELSGAALP